MATRIELIDKIKQQLSPQSYEAFEQQYNAGLHNIIQKQSTNLSKWNPAQNFTQENAKDFVVTLQVQANELAIGLAHKLHQDIAKTSHTERADNLANTANLSPDAANLVDQPVDTEYEVHKITSRYRDFGAANPNPNLSAYLDAVRDSRPEMFDEIERSFDGLDNRAEAVLKMYNKFKASPKPFVDKKQELENELKNTFKVTGPKPF